LGIALPIALLTCRSAAISVVSYHSLRIHEEDTGLVGSDVVVTDIPVGTVYAYRRGQLIERDAVEANNWQDYVKSAGTKEAREAALEDQAGGRADAA
jgi:hypothetical protein